MSRLLLVPLLLTMLGACAHAPTTTEPPEPAPIIDQDAHVRQLVAEEIGSDPLLPIIFGCESTGNPHQIRHRNEDGSLLKNPTSSASGYAQVLLQFHSDWIAETGLNMQDDREYTRFVNILFRRQGYGAWYPSEDCWGPYRNRVIATS